jgi:hypothetical protein
LLELAMLEHRDHKVLPGLKVLLVPKVHREMSVPREQLVHKVPLVHKEIPAPKVLLELKDHREM